MAYSTGTLNSVVDFPSILDTFLLANGWTKTVNSSVITGVTLSYNAGGTGTLSYSANALNAVPLGSKLTFTGSGSANIYLTRKGSSTSGSQISDATFTTLTAGSCTFSWNTYNKGTKYFNFAGAIHSQNSIQYILFDLYHSGTGNHNLVTHAQSCRFNPAFSNIPCTYYLFSSGTPDVVTGVFTFGTEVQWFTVGDLVKVHSSAYPGGEYLAASANIINSISTAWLGYNSIADSQLASGQNVGGYNALPFSIGIPGTTLVSNGILHAEIDGLTYTLTDGTTLAYISVTQNCARKLYRGLNDWNQQALLVVPEIQSNALSSFKKYLGYMEHFRYIRIDNYNLNDTITLGSDTWRVFSTHKKDTILRAGGGSTPYSTGTLGFAVRYVP